MWKVRWGGWRWTIEPEMCSVLRWLWPRCREKRQLSVWSLSGRRCLPVLEGFLYHISHWASQAKTPIMGRLPFPQLSMFCLHEIRAVAARSTSPSASSSFFIGGSGKWSLRVCSNLDVSNFSFTRWTQLHVLLTRWGQLPSARVTDLYHYADIVIWVCGNTSRCMMTRFFQRHYSQLREVRYVSQESVCLGTFALAVPSAWKVLPLDISRFALTLSGPS
jgi:hypothetical protein